jgi:hypothetical protein
MKVKIEKGKMGTKEIFDLAIYNRPKDTPLIEWVRENFFEGYSCGECGKEIDIEMIDSATNFTKIAVLYCKDCTERPPLAKYGHEWFIGKEVKNGNV